MFFWKKSPITQQVCVILDGGQPAVNSDKRWSEIESHAGVRLHLRFPQPYWLGCFLRGKQEVHEAFNVYKIKNKPVYLHLLLH